MSSITRHRRIDRNVPWHETTDTSPFEADNRRWMLEYDVVEQFIGSEIVHIVMEMRVAELVPKPNQNVIGVHGECGKEFPIGTEFYRVDIGIGWIGLIKSIFG